MNRWILRTLALSSSLKSHSVLHHSHMAKNKLLLTLKTLPCSHGWCCTDSVSFVLARRMSRLHLTGSSGSSRGKANGGDGGAGGSRWRWRPLSDRCKERCGLALAASWFTMLTVQSECDNVDFDLLIKNKILESDQEQTGWERLVAMYTLDEMGGLTPELELVRGVGTAGLLIGGTLGAMLNSRLAIIKFVERNTATVFESQLAAKRALQDRVTLGLARGFFMFGWRTALFTSAFSLISTSLMVYTNEVSALHYAAAGLVTGALYKVNMGLRGMTAGAVAGGLLGLIGGGVFSLACYLTDTTLPQLRYQQYLWKYQQELRDKERAERKREKKRQANEKKLEETKREIVQSHLQQAAADAVDDGVPGGPDQGGGSGGPAQPVVRGQPRTGGDRAAATDQATERAGTHSSVAGSSAAPETAPLGSS